ncbi:YnfA family protein [Conexibacter woesei]|uniref:hypothetical protein n=1 Tax=Conexibacter woesei TaxID=191495 RepID=UPI001F4573CB|nr:hypothetical protein [Conexibacter woesei]
MAAARGRRGRRGLRQDGDVTGRSIALFLAAALAEIGGAYLVWIGLRENKSALVCLAGVATITYARR